MLKIVFRCKMPGEILQLLKKAKKGTNGETERSLQEAINCCDAEAYMAISLMVWRALKSKGVDDEEEIMKKLNRESNWSTGGSLWESYIKKGLEKL